MGMVTPKIAADLCICRLQSPGTHPSHRAYALFSKQPTFRKELGYQSMGEVIRAIHLAHDASGEGIYPSTTLILEVPRGGYIVWASIDETVTPLVEEWDNGDPPMTLRETRGYFFQLIRNQR